MNTEIKMHKTDTSATNSYDVTVTAYGETMRHSVYTNDSGRGLWVDGQQVLGTSQFEAGRNPASAIRRYFARRYGAA